MLPLLVPLVIQAQAEVHPVDVVGLWDGGRTEIAAMLEITADGRFRYALSYGALDEVAEGRWTVLGGAVTLMADHFHTNVPKDPAYSGIVRDFADIVLRWEGDALLLQRHDTLLRFRRAAGQ